MPAPREDPAVEIPRRPARLRPGSVIGVAAPASPFDPEVFGRGVEVLRSVGFEVVVPEGVFARRGYLAGDDAARAALLQGLLCDERVDAVMCARGGYGCLRMLPLLDYAALSQRPKALIGYSDVTALHAAVGKLCGCVTFHGPLVTTLATASEVTLRSFRDALLAAEPQVFRLADDAAIRPGAAAGALAGGNLTTLCHLVGTPYMPDLHDRILFVEDRGEAPYRIDRMLAHLDAAGCLGGVRGVVLGSFEACGSADEIREIAAERFGERGIPVLAGLAAGHTDPNLTLPLGAEAVLDADAGTLTVAAGTRPA